MEEYYWKTSKLMKSTVLKSVSTDTEINCIKITL